LTFKKEKLAFEILGTMIIIFNVDQIVEFITKLIPILIDTQKKLEFEKSNTFRDFKRNFLTLISKMMSKYDFENLYKVIENINVGLTLQLFYDLLTSVKDIEEHLFKKLTIQQYCLIIAKFSNQIGLDTTIAYTVNIIIALEQFYKMTDYYISEKPIEIEDVYNYSCKNSFKLKNFIIPVSFYHYFRI